MTRMGGIFVFMPIDDLPLLEPGPDEVSSLERLHRLLERGFDDVERRSRKRRRRAKHEQSVRDAQQDAS